MLLLRVEFVHRQMLLVLVPMVLYPSCCGSCTVYVTSIATNDVKERVVYMSDAVVSSVRTEAICCSALASSAMPFMCMHA